MSTYPSNKKPLSPFLRVLPSTFGLKKINHAKLNYRRNLLDKTQQIKQQLVESIYGFIGQQIFKNIQMQSCMGISAIHLFYLGANQKIESKEIFNHIQRQINRKKKERYQIIIFQQTDKPHLYIKMYTSIKKYEKPPLKTPVFIVPFSVQEDFFLKLQKIDLGDVFYFIGLTHQDKKPQTRLNIKINRPYCQKSLFYEFFAHCLLHPKLTAYFPKQALELFTDPYYYPLTFHDCVRRIQTLFTKRYIHVDAKKQTINVYQERLNRIFGLIQVFFQKKYSVDTCKIFVHLVLDYKQKLSNSIQQQQVKKMNRKILDFILKKGMKDRIADFNQQIKILKHKNLENINKKDRLTKLNIGKVQTKSDILTQKLNKLIKEETQPFRRQAAQFGWKNYKYNQTVRPQIIQNIVRELYSAQNPLSDLFKIVTRGYQLHKGDTFFQFIHIQKQKQRQKPQVNSKSVEKKKQITHKKEDTINKNPQNKQKLKEFNQYIQTHLINSSMSQPQKVQRCKNIVLQYQFYYQTAVLQFMGIIDYDSRNQMFLINQTYAKTDFRVNDESDQVQINKQLEKQQMNKIWVAQQHRQSPRELIQKIQQTPVLKKKYHEQTPPQSPRKPIKRQSQMKSTGFNMNIEYCSQNKGYYPEQRVLLQQQTLQYYANLKARKEEQQQAQFKIPKPTKNIKKK